MPIHVIHFIMLHTRYATCHTCHHTTHNTYDTQKTQENAGPAHRRPKYLHHGPPAPALCAYSILCEQDLNVVRDALVVDEVQHVVHEVEQGMVLLDGDVQGHVVHLELGIYKIHDLVRLKERSSGQGDVARTQDCMNHMHLRAMNLPRGICRGHYCRDVRLEDDPHQVLNMLRGTPNEAHRGVHVDPAPSHRHFLG